MKPQVPSAAPAASRRAFLKQSGSLVLGAAIAGATARPGYAAEQNTIKVALIGCGGRGTGAAANALQTRGPIKLWAMADAFEGRLSSSLANLQEKFAAQLDVPKERQFGGLGGFKQAIDSLDRGDVVILATPPAFRPPHVEYAVERGVHVFMEKSFGVDAPGIRRILRAGEAAKAKNLKIAGGLMWRHDRPRQEVIQRLHDGAIGDLILLRTYRMHGAVGFQPKAPGQSELAHQIANYSNFTWLNGSFFVDWLIHNLDVCCWAKNALPISAQGMGGRQVRTEPDQMFDHYSVEYAFADGTRLLAQGRHINKCWDQFSDLANGAKGSAVIMENLSTPNPRIYSRHEPTPANLVWRYTGPPCEPYQVEFDLLLDAIRNDRPYNESERCAKACLTAILGRRAVESGQLLTWDEAFTSNVELAPGLDHLTLESVPPVQPDPTGHYPLPVPGSSAG